MTLAWITLAAVAGVLVFKIAKAVHRGIREGIKEHRG